MDRVAEMLGHFRGRGVRIWLEEGQLRYKAPAGALTRDEIDSLRRAKGQILTLLKEPGEQSVVRTRQDERCRLDHAPAAFSQLAHWRLYQLGKKPSVRNIASATRLRGSLNIDILQKSLAEVVRRHDALRTRIVQSGGIPVQDIATSGHIEPRMEDLTGLAEDLRDAAVTRHIREFILEPIEVSADPLLGILLLKVHAGEHVLVAAMEHMISDSFSMGIFLRELFTAYSQLVQGSAFSLPSIPVQFSDYAAWQATNHPSWLERHIVYWTERMQGYRRARFPGEISPPDPTSAGWGNVPVYIEGELLTQLREWCRQRGTTLVIGVLAAYVGSVLRWCNETDVVIQYQSDGRTSPKLQNTIGYVAAVLFLRIALREEDSCTDLLNRVIEEYCKAYEHCDFSYLEAQVPRPEFVRSVAFNWVPAGAPIEPVDLDGSQTRLTYSAVPFEHPLLEVAEKDHDPVLLLYEADESARGAIYFPLCRFRVPAMDRFGRIVTGFMRAMLASPETRVKGIPLTA